MMLEQPTESLSDIPLEIDPRSIFLELSFVARRTRENEQGVPLSLADSDHSDPGQMVLNSRERGQTLTGGCYELWTM
jgi:hypothetical protein